MFDLVIANTNLVDITSNQIITADIYIKGSKIAEISERKVYGSHLRYPARTILNAKMLYAIPGLIDAHVHIESSLLALTEFAKLVLRSGTTTIIADPHEICNVLGIKGLTTFMREARRLPLNTYFMLPSCVPASLFGTSGAVLTANDLRLALNRYSTKILGLGEVMNFPGVIAREPALMAKIQICKGKIINGHAPGLRGDKLKKYVSAGIHDDHESLTVDEIREKLELGMAIMLREGSGATSPREFYEILKTSRYGERIMFCTDDKDVRNIITNGHVIYNLRKAIQLGVDPFLAIRAATYHPAQHFKLTTIGMIQRAKNADIVLVQDLRELVVIHVIVNGKIIYRNKRCVWKFGGYYAYPQYVTRSIKIPLLTEDHFNIAISQQLRATNKKVTANVIKVIDRSLLTDWLKLKLIPTENFYDLKRDILKIAVINRYKLHAKPALGLITGFGLQQDSAIASSISHDCHNIIAVGTSDHALCQAVNAVINRQGALIAISNSGNKNDDNNISRHATTGSKCVAVNLPVAGLMSNKNYRIVSKQLENLELVVKRLGCKLTSPFTTLSFMALEVIPRLKITDRGLFDVEKFKFVDVFTN
jgi:adenine deaminase